MTNSSLSSALKFIFPAIAAACVCGCDADGSKAYDKGLSLYQLRDFKGAAECFAQTAVKSPRDVDAKVMLARSRLHLGEVVEAKAAIDEAAGVAPDEFDVRMLDAEIAYHSKDYESALRIYGKVIADGAATPEIRSLAYSGRGIVQTALEQRDLARIDFLLAIRQDRRNASARYHLALLYRDAYGYVEAAIDEFRFFVRINELADSRVQNVQTTVIPELQKQVQQAAADRPGAAKRDPKACGEALLVADSAFKNGKWRAAKVKYQEAYSADPLSYPAALGVAKSVAKTDTSEAGKAERFKYLKYACELRPGAISTFIETADLAYSMGRYAVAVEAYSRAVAADSGNITAIDGLIRSLRKAGGKDKVAAAYQAYRDTIPVRRRK